MSQVSTTDAPPASKISRGLARVLVRLGIATEQELEEFSNQEATKLLTTIVNEKDLDEIEVLRRLSRELSVPISTMTRMALQRARESLPPDNRLTKEFCINNRCVLLSYDEDCVRVAMCDPLDFECVSPLEFMFQRRIKVELAPESQVLRAILWLFGEDDGTAEEIIRDDELEIVAQTKEKVPTASGLDSPPVVLLLNRILRESVELRASDVHLVPTAQDLDVRLRIDGVLQQHSTVSKKLQPYLLSRTKLLAGMDIAERRRPQDGRFRVKFSNGGYRDIRASAVPTPHGETIVLRILSSSAADFRLDKIGLLDESRAEFERALRSTDQIVLVTGPTGSGKSTTLYAALNYLHTGERKIVTVEDPIESRIDGITQIQVDSKIGVSFATGLRSILRQDPDVILVGEIRDQETAEVALQAAQTGHLVLSTLHTNDAPAAVVRLRDLGVEPFVLSSSLRAVIAQRLVRTVCQSCSSPLAEEEQIRLVSRYRLKEGNLRYGKGCVECSQTGYHGRIGVYSLLNVTPEIREAIRNKADSDQIQAIAKTQGMKDLAEVALELVESGVTTAQEAERVLGMKELEDAVNGRSHLTAKDDDDCLVPGLKGRKRTRSSTSLSLMSEEEESPKRILVVDDDSGVRAVLARILRKEKCEVIEVSNGEEALALLDQMTPDLIICDLAMPKMDGRDVLRNVRARGINIPFLILSGSDSEENEAALIESGADDFLSKAASPAVVTARVKRALSRVR